MRDGHLLDQPRRGGQIIGVGRTGEQQPERQRQQRAGGHHDQRLGAHEAGCRLTQRRIVQSVRGLRIETGQHAVGGFDACPDALDQPGDCRGVPGYRFRGDRTGAQNEDPTAMLGENHGREGLVRPQ